MQFTQTELSLIAEALDARIETGMFDVQEDIEGDINFCSPSHLAAIEALADKVVSMQEAEQD